MGWRYALTVDGGASERKGDRCVDTNLRIEDRTGYLVPVMVFALFFGLPVPMVMDVLEIQQRID